MAAYAGFKDESMPEEPTPSEVIPLDTLEQLRTARAVIRQEARALESLADSLDSVFCDAVQLIRQSTGCVIVTGVGKAGLIGQKIVATLGSTGTRAWFLHPTEALHGDIACVHNDDVVLAVSNSGRSEEILKLLPPLAERQVPVIALTRDGSNPLSKAAAITINIGRHEEAGELKLAPTTSTTALLAAGDALALTISKAEGFTARDFARSHPAGSLGRQLQSVQDFMRTGDDLRLAGESETIRSVLVDQQRPGRRSGAILMVTSDGTLSGIFTDSDLVRLFEQHREDQLDRPISEVMTFSPCTIVQSALMSHALELMSARKVSELPVIDQDGYPVGLIDITDVIDQPAAKTTSAASPTRRTA
jgi:arabinose-5-phosphate isomerase